LSQILYLISKLLKLFSAISTRSKEQRLSAVEGYCGWIRIVSLDKSLGRENVLVPRIGDSRNILIGKGQRGMDSGRWWKGFVDLAN
jgi:hypothetical protein